MSNDNTVIIYHITTREAWEQSQQAGQYTAPSLNQEGFIHTSTGKQVADTANRFYRGQTGLVLLVLDPSRLQAEVRFDPVHTHGEEQFFPHIYGPVNLDAVTQVLTFQPDAAGVFHFEDR